jgi:hypothetical protein
MVENRGEGSGTTLVVMFDQPPVEFDSEVMPARGPQDSLRADVAEQLTGLP